MNKILLIDDDVNFKESFHLEAETNSFQLIYKRSFEGLQEIMPKVHHAIAAVVLDIKCLISEGQEREDEGFIGAATKYLDMNFPRFPRIILTGDDGAFDGYKKFASGEDIYHKTPEGISQAFLKLQYYADNSETLRIQRENIRIFDLFENGYYDSTTKETLLNLLRSVNESDYTRFGGILRDVRSLQETIYKVLNVKDNQLVPNNMFQSNGMIKFNDLMNHLNGNPKNRFIPTTRVYHNNAIFNISNSIYWICSQYVHANPTETYFISNYTTKSMIYGLMEIFIWSEDYLK